MHKRSLVIVCIVLNVFLGSQNLGLAPVRQGDGWTLLFAYDFDGQTLDANKWTTCYWWQDHWTTDGCTNEATQELQWYHPDNVIVSDGTLKIRALKQTVVTEDINGDKKTYDYTSGMITSGRNVSDTSVPAKFVFQYGYAEIRAKIPAGQGMWPAFWLLPADHKSKPEIDAMEILGHEPDRVYMYIHHSDSSSSESWKGYDFSADWHTFAVDWQPGVIVWYVDGVERWRYAVADHIPATPMYLLLSLAVGGEWPGAPDASTGFPSYYEIDYVKVWQRSP
jgi:beta-glucanase (GH16 family)